MNSFHVLRCASVLNRLGSACRNCILLQQATFFLCASFPASRFDTNYGLMILSRKELNNAKVTLYNPASQFRAYLEASVSLVLG